MGVIIITFFIDINLLEGFWQFVWCLFFYVCNFRTLSLSYSQHIHKMYCNLFSWHIVISKVVFFEWSNYVNSIEVFLGKNNIRMNENWCLFFINTVEPMARTPFGPWKSVRDMGSSSHWGLIMVPGQKQNNDNLWIFYFCHNNYMSMRRF